MAVVTKGTIRSRGYRVGDERRGAVDGAKRGVVRAPKEVVSLASNSDGEVGLISAFA